LAKNIVLYLTDTDAEYGQWLICDDQGNAVSETRRDTLENIADQVEGRKLTVILPAEAVSLFSVTVAGNASRAVKAIPFALEEMVSQDIEDLHFAVGDRQSGDTYPVAVVAQALMQKLQQRFAEVGLRPVAMRAEAQALPRFQEDDAGWTALSDGDRVLVRIDDFSGYAIDRSSAEVLLGQSLEEAADDPPAGMVLFTTDEAELSLDTVALDVEQRPCDDVLKLLARGVHNSPAINILQGDYSFKQQFDRAWRPWRPAIALAAALVIAVGAGKFMEYRAVASELAEQNAQMEDILRRTFPSIRRVVNPRKQMQSELKKLGAGGGDGFVSVIKQVSDALGSTGNTNLNAISYKTGRLDLDLDTDRISTLDRLKQSLETGGQFSMTIDSANQSKGRIRGRIRVEVRG